MSNPSPANATPWQRVAATLINVGLVLVLALVAERIAALSGAPSSAARATIASKALFGLCALFWLGCGHMRTSPGLALLKLRVIPAPEAATRIPLSKSLIRPLPFFIFGIVVTFPVELIPRSVAPIQFLLVLASSLLLAANTTTLWSGPDRRTLLDRWLKVQVVRK